MTNINGKFLKKVAYGVLLLGIFTEGSTRGADGAPVTSALCQRSEHEVKELSLSDGEQLMDRSVYPCVEGKDDEGPCEKLAEQADLLHKPPLIIWLRKWDNNLGNSPNKKCFLESPGEPVQGVNIDGHKFAMPDNVVELEYLNGIMLFIDNLVKELTPHVAPSVIIATKENDPIINIKYVDFKEKNRIKQFINRIIVADVSSFSNTLNELIQQTPIEHHVLTISFGISTHYEGDLDGFGNLVVNGLQNFKGYFSEGQNKEVYAYGWKINYERFAQEQQYRAFHRGSGWFYNWNMSSYSNDGTDLGKCWYNTSALLSARFIALLKSYPIPPWIDNGKEGTLEISQGEKVLSVPIGGLEEIYMMHLAVRDNPAATFILDDKNSLYISEKVGSGVQFLDKMLRKIPIAHYYMRQKLDCYDCLQLLKHVLLLSKTMPELN